MAATVTQPARNTSSPWAVQEPSRQVPGLAYCPLVADVASAGGERVRAAEVMAVLSLATDLGIGVPLEHGLQSTLVAMRLGERLGVDSGTASQT